MTIYYKNGFYTEPQENSVEITAEQYEALLIGQSQGKQIISNKQGEPVLIEPQPSAAHELNLDTLEWVILPEKLTALLTEQRKRVFAQIVAKRDECVNGGVYVERIGKWVDTDEKGRATLVEIKADFDLNGKENSYTLICSDNTAYTLNFDDFKSVWDAVKTLKEKMFENAYMHQILLEQAENPLEYDWSIGWSKTYEESKN
ncbi:DUF4376 domain-containing protein [Rodentibacter trehalosifermentans]|uniref:DUF4376 domain-containing protein n=1 Tax=Rodentibacter trehalosifermentans TaxID=1908263 RepID=UPI0009C73A92|nr:DUF4376 domain-containing protein [Rodentibacter trehalosifermentans]OOF48640.1 hypothetical protein BKK53_09555 [Rodentibacter trehalosifermentans]